MSNTMKAILMEKVKDLKYIDYPKPSPKQDEVLLKIMAVGVCGSDIPRMLVYGSHVLPIIPGHEFAGCIEQLGTNVKGWSVGDKATAAPLLPCNKCEMCNQGIYSLCEDYKYYGSRNNGAYAQYLCVKAKNLLRLDKNTPYDWGATIDPAANAIHAFLRGNGTKEDTVCVFGLGAIGLFAVQYAKYLGCKQIIAIDINDNKLNDALKCGATITINSAKQDIFQVLNKATSNKGANLVLEMSGFPQAQHQAILSASKMGRIVFLGISHKGLELSEQAVDKIERYQLSINGSWNSFSDPFPGFEWTQAANLMNTQAFNPNLIITHRYPLSKLPDIFNKIDKKDPNFIYNKIMFYPHDNK